MHIADDVFGLDDQYGLSYETFIVRGSFPPDDGITALHRAGNRFMVVDETGVEHPLEMLYTCAAVADEDGNWLYTPNYVDGPRPVPGGLRVCVDCKGGIEPAMGATFRRILEEELGHLSDDVTVVVDKEPWPEG